MNHEANRSGSAGVGSEIFHLLKRAADDTQQPADYCQTARLPEIPAAPDSGLIDD